MLKEISQKEAIKKLEEGGAVMVIDMQIGRAVPLKDLLADCRFLVDVDTIDIPAFMRKGEEHGTREAVREQG